MSKHERYLGYEGILSAQNSQEVDKCESHAPYLMYQLAMASDILLTGVNVHFRAKLLYMS